MGGKAALLLALVAVSLAVEIHADAGYGYGGGYGTTGRRRPPRPRSRRSDPRAASRPRSTGPSRRSRPRATSRPRSTSLPPTPQARSRRRPRTLPLPSPLRRCPSRRRRPTSLLPSRRRRCPTPPARRRPTTSEISATLLCQARSIGYVLESSMHTSSNLCQIPFYVHLSGMSLLNKMVIFYLLLQKVMEEFVPANRLAKR